ncbi:N-fatty-acyl-amino acid synthase/hydrolase PM20D1-like [Amphiura filiformis]|uniref:N-fatty-acyl-amino acid synthase/hydrolase PM20D1-like n=1 Tax=Amphiura filiformis TaxID=82378 RepID=UPI003B216665
MIALILASGAIGFVGLVIFRTLTYPNKQIKPSAGQSFDTSFIQENEDRLVSNLQQVVRFNTTSRERGDMNYEEILKVHQFIQQAFPTIHSSPLVKREVINQYSLLYTVEGSEPSLKPYILCAHMDVVPVEEDSWDVPPFEGRLVDGFIYGRGTLDDKHSLLGILEALEFLLQRGEKPVRPIILAFGHDEEVEGRDGAKEIAAVLKDRGIQAEFLIDEGLTVTDGLVPGMSNLVALVGVAEKGYLNLELSVDSAPTGHASMPPKETNIGILSQAVSRLETNPFPSMFGKGPERAMFEFLGAEIIFPLKMVIANFWLFSPIFEWIMSRKPSTNAFLRTTTALTVFKGGIKRNVLPPSATANINFRIHPAQTVQDVIDYVKKVVNDDRIKLKTIAAHEPSHISPYSESSLGFKSIAQCVKQVFPGASVSPSVLIANTDTKWYPDITANRYRFFPVVTDASDINRIHGHNERISIGHYLEMVQFYYLLMKHADNHS